MQNFEKGHKKFFSFFMGDESPNAKDSKSMIGFVPSAQQPTLQSSKVQKENHWQNPEIFFFQGRSFLEGKIQKMKKKF